MAEPLYRLVTRILVNIRRDRQPREEWADLDRAEASYATGVLVIRAGAL
jgi:hypothetical protein